MKQILAAIRLQAMNRTREALVNAGVSSFTVRKVLGRGKGNVDFRVLQGAQEGQIEAIAQLGSGPLLVPKRLLSLVVAEEQVAKVVQTIIAANRTNTAGDGKIFVLPVGETIRVRTGERGVKALA